MWSHDIMTYFKIRYSTVYLKKKKLYDKKKELHRDTAFSPNSQIRQLLHC